MAALWTALVAFLAACFGVTLGGEYCRDRYSYYTYYTYKYCAYGCCSGDCCGMTAWIIVLIVIGVIVAVSVTVALICCCIKSKGSTGRVVHPVQPTSGVTVINTGSSQQTTAWGQPGPYGPPPYQSGPPGYTQQYGFKPGQPAPPPPAYSDPAYPPGQSNASPFAAAANNA